MRGVRNKGHITRRSFLSAAAGSALAAASGCVSKARLPAREDRIRIGVIGCGQRGTQHLTRLCDVEEPRGGAEIIAVCDVYRPRLEQAHRLSHARAYQRWEDLLADQDVDAVIIATPDHWHAPMTLAAMQAGKDVYCEAPMTLDAAEAGAVAAAAAKSGRVVQIGAQRTSEGQWHAAARLIREDALGPVRWSHADCPLEAGAATMPSAGAPPPHADLDWTAFLGGAPEHPFTPERFFHWRRFWDYSRGVAAQQHFQHLAPLLVAVGAEHPLRVSAAGGVYALDGRETPDALMANLEYASGHTIVLTAAAVRKPEAPVVRGRDAAITFHGDRLDITSEAPRLLGIEKASNQPAQKKVAVQARPDHLENWLACIRTREACVCGPKLGYATQLAVDLAVQAFRLENTLTLETGTMQATRTRPRGLDGVGAAG